ncbi:MAG TPA: histidine kinase dimerization/phosphoacceptor domain -containing protein [Bryobacteraceae bacterium]|nr:histidine kinase dimerization/phosphoacceptor domain -containing protein [Bryobacteraceae bacterium]
MSSSTENHKSADQTLAPMSRVASARIAIRVLVLEDQQSDAELMMRQLRRSGFAPVWERVETEADYVAQLASSPDIILADYRMPQMDAERALEILRDSGLTIPFIVVSGAIGEDVAVAMMRHGASDYLLKDRMARLGPAVRHALEQRALQEQTRKAAGELRASEIRFQSFMNNSPTLARIKEADGRLVYMNNACEQLFGVSSAECEGKTDAEFCPAEVAERLRARDSAVLHDGEPSHVVEEVKLHSGRTMQLLMFRFLLHDACGEPMLGEVSADITDQIRTQRALAEALQAKEILFRELHHRVKNNLNVVSSLLSMQAQLHRDSAAGQALADAQRRIESMALVHDRLNQKDRGDAIDFQEYAAGLARNLFDVYRPGGGVTRLRLDLSPVPLVLTQAVPCGLILNELITNALKYAFPHGESGEIAVSLRSDDKGLVTLSVSDDGAGLPSDFAWRSSPSLGLRIVDILSRQLDATVEVGSGPGACFTVRFQQLAGAAVNHGRCSEIF